MNDQGRLSLRNSEGNFLEPVEGSFVLRPINSHGSNNLDIVSQLRSYQAISISIQFLLRDLTTNTPVAPTLGRCWTQKVNTKVSMTRAFMARSIAFLVVTVLIPSPFVGGSPTGNRPALIKAADVPIATVDSVTTGTNVVFDSAPTDSVDWKFKFDIHAKAHPAYVAPKGTDFHVPNEAFCALDLSAPMARLWHLSRTDLFNLMTWALYIPERQVWSGNKSSMNWDTANGLKWFLYERIWRRMYSSIMRWQSSTLSASWRSKHLSRNESQVWP